MTFSNMGTDKDTGEPVNSYKTSRTQGLYALGLQRMGKSGMFENLIIDDIKQGTGVFVLDPHGELIDHVIARLPGKAEEEKVIYLDIKDMSFFFGLPLLDNADLTDELSVERTRSQFLHVFEKAFGITEANPVMYTLLSNIAYTLIANPGYTMTDIRQLLTNRTCRESLLQNTFLLENKTALVDFWHTHYDQLSPQRQDEESFYILNKLNDFENAPLRYMVGQSKSTINLQKIMDESKILLVKLDRQLEQATSLIGSILVALILNASDSRNSKKLFNVYADELQNFATPDFAVLLEQAGKRNIGISMAHQNRAQLQLSDKQADAQLKARTLNVGSLVVFRVPTGSVTLAQQFDATPDKEVVGFRPLLSPKNDVVGHLRTQGHSHPAVIAFTNNYLVPAMRVVEANRRYGGNIRVSPLPGLPKRRVLISDLDNAINELNTLLYSVSVDKNANKDITPLVFIMMARLYGFSKGFAWYVPIYDWLRNEQAPTFFKPKLPLLQICSPDYHNHKQELEREISPFIFTPALSFVTSLRKTMAVLSVDAILVNTGQHQEIYRERTFADRTNEISNMLVSLPKFQARVKLTDANGMIVEHTIATREPEKGLYGRLLDERIARIQKQNRKPNPYGYTPSKQDVEQEIIKRQSHWSHQSGFQPPQPPQARKMPACQSCGANNSQGAKFCNQCGEKF